MSTMILQPINTFGLKYFIYKSTRKQALGLQNTDFMGHIFINYLQHLKPFQHQIQSKFWQHLQSTKKVHPPLIRSINPSFRAAKLTASNFSSQESV
jgi:hypothetical protein